ncbi:hypothetical protein N656DRAFT_134610 [Canariomyces notabilis]|uniref:Secreted peptide n=1 Tax=Canariomyces notabilis TaxID=2074819 RepID=A0AAN6YSI8_9PEZI|nr:hypothetical protein N656DRAFT_134610 [Canariomyces arenarius]
MVVPLVCLLFWPGLVLFLLLSSPSDAYQTQLLSLFGLSLIPLCQLPWPSTVFCAALVPAPFRRLGASSDLHIRDDRTASLPLSRSASFPQQGSLRQLIIPSNCY